MCKLFSFYSWEENIIIFTFYFLFFIVIHILYLFLFSNEIHDFSHIFIYRYGKLSRFAPTSHQRNAFHSIVKKVTVILSFVSLFTVLRLILLCKFWILIILNLCEIWFNHAMLWLSPFSASFLTIKKDFLCYEWYFSILFYLFNYQFIFGWINYFRRIVSYESILLSRRVLNCMPLSENFFGWSYLNNDKTLIDLAKVF